MKLYGFEANQIACIGDQIMTDIFGANRVGCVSILINPIGSQEPPWTRFNRIWEKMVLKRLTKKGLFEKGKYYE